EQSRGLDEIDFLSYIVVPVASSLGQPEEIGLGILHVETRLFAAPPDKFANKLIDPARRVYKAQLVRSDLTDLGIKLYDQEDVGVKYLEEMRAVLVPILHLYWKCRQGST
ncbi:MAG TPA: hypothetical protein VLU47_14175, partial [Blastocatellia bacterium]|nr:hypothetical protein [Blastocatellia bacterium]